MTTKTPLRTLTEEHGKLIADTWEGVNYIFPNALYEQLRPLGPELQNLKCPTQKFFDVVSKASETSTTKGFDKNLDTVIYSDELQGVSAPIIKFLFTTTYEVSRRMCEQALAEFFLFHQKEPELSTAPPTIIAVDPPDFSTEMEIIVDDKHQSNDLEFTQVVSKRARRRMKAAENKKKFQQQLETKVDTQRATSKAEKGNVPLTHSKLSPTATSTIRNITKKPRHLSQNPESILTGRKAEGTDLLRVKDVVVYDVPAEWPIEDLLTKFSVWGDVISIKTKAQRKYQTVRVKIVLTEAYLAAFFRGDWMVPLDNTMVRWFPATWSLAERKERERFQAVLRCIPDDLAPAAFYDHTNNCPKPFLQEAGLKAYKFITTVDKKRKLVGFFETWATLQMRLSTPTTWNGVNMDWSRHSPPTNLSRSRPPTTFSKGKNKSGSVASGANTTPISTRRNTTNKDDNKNPTGAAAKHTMQSLEKSAARIKDPNQKRFMVELVDLLGKLIK